MTAPPGASEALNKYLELQPEGQHAADVKQMLQAIGSKVETTYKKGKGK
jgi:type II secretory pathway component PulL